MSELEARQRRMQVLVRMRDLQQDRAELAWQQAVLAERSARERADLARSRLEAAARAGAGALVPELHRWRLAGVEQERMRAVAAEQRRQEADEALHGARAELVRRRLDVRVAEQAAATATDAVQQEQQRAQWMELADLQLFCRREEA